MFKSQPGTTTLLLLPVKQKREGVERGGGGQGVTAGFLGLNKKWEALTSGIFMPEQTLRRQS